MWVCTDTLCTQVSMSLCTQADAPRIDGCTCVSHHRFSQIYNVYGHPSIFRYMYFGAAPRRACAKYIMCMDIRLYLDTCTSERRRDARVGVRLRRVRARLRQRWAHLPQGTVAVPNASVCLSRACGCVCVYAWSPLHGFGPFVPTSAHWCAAGAVVRGRYIHSTKVTALPESLGKCKLLKTLCVRAAEYTHAHTRTCVYIHTYIFYIYEYSYL